MLDITLFGPTTVAGGTTRITGTALGGTKPRQLLEMLALQPGTPLSKDVLAEQLWDGRPPVSYITTLEGYVCALRRRLGIVSGRRGALATTHHGYVLDPEQVRVDAVEARRLLETGSDQDVVGALALIGGTLLVEDPFAGWAISAREAMDELVAARCTVAARAANACGDTALAVRLGREAVRCSYLSEAATLELMDALAASGARAEALHTYEVLSRGLREDLGLEPEGRVRQTYLEILRSPDRAAGTAWPREEIAALVGLLRRALDRHPGRVTDLPEMYEVGRLLMSRAG